jgi:uncharacterized protein YjbI with pentapeptide repeats
MMAVRKLQAMLKLLACLSAASALKPLDRRTLFSGAAAALAPARLLAPAPALAVSGGGKDYAEATIKGQDFSGKTFNNKDFSGCDAVDTNFAKSKLRGARFFKADLARADFSGADLSAASLEGANLEGTKLTGALAEGTAFSQTILDAGDLTGADFTDAVIQPYVQKGLCGRKDVTGATRDSLFCP